MLILLRRALLQCIRLCRILLAWLRRRSTRYRGQQHWAADPKRHCYAQPKPAWVCRDVVRLKGSLAPWSIEDGEQLDRTLPNVRTWYNHLRPHAHLHGRTPAEVWAGVDVFADTPQAAMWRKRWERQWWRACRAGPWGSV